MNVDEILASFREKVGSDVEIEPQREGRFIVHTPFAFGDGDHYVVVLHQTDSGWVLTDEGHTAMHLSYCAPDTAEGDSGSVVRSTGVRNRRGELLLEVGSGDFGDALRTFVGAINCMVRSRGEK